MNKKDFGARLLALRKQKKPPEQIECYDVFLIAVVIFTCIK